jgi:MtN3 and saliva related transmembrane protein
MMDVFWYVIGSIAAILTMFGFVPQIVKIVKTKCVRDISFAMLIQTGIGAFLWIVYGIHINDPIVIIANVVSFILLILAIAFFLTYRFNKR